MSPEESFDPQLLEMHLGRLTPAEEVRLRVRLATEPELAKQNETLSAVFRALETHQVSPAPAGLAERIAARVAAAGPPPRVVRPTDELTAAVEANGSIVLRLGNLREIVAAAAMIILMVGLAVPSLLQLRERNLRMGCSANLAALGVGLQQYAQTYNASLPFAGWRPGAFSWAPSNDPNVVTVPNRRHIYPLLRQAYVVSPRVFVCPARGGVPMPAEQVRQRSDFIESDNVSYAYYNMAGVRPSASDNPDLPIMADDNPVFDDGVPLLNRWGLGDRAKLNSRAHDGAGQNILCLDGRVKWVDTPFAGIDGDNIWTLAGVKTYTGREGPISAKDAHLIK